MKDSEEDNKILSKNSSKEDSILSFEKEKKDLDLLDLNFNIRKGEMIAVIGSIGSGKSSLLYSLLG